MASGLGIDLVAVGAVADSLRGAHAEHYLERVYTPREVEDCRDAAGEVDPRRLAARFAAKEAAMKALGGGEEVRLTDIELRREPSGAVRLELSGRPAELAAQAGIDELAVSLTHEGEYAAAVVAASWGGRGAARLGSHD